VFNLTMPAFTRHAVLLAAFAAASALCGASPSLRFEESEAGIVLRGRDARWQVLVTARDAAGREHDVTRNVRYSVSPAGVCAVTREGVVTPAGDGVAQVVAHGESSLTTTVAVRVAQAAVSAPVHFANQIVPLFTKHGCNGGGCHGKSAGQNGFRLSLLGFEPVEDYEHLVKEARGRRVSTAAPGRSLLLLKADGTLPHGGGKRLDPDSPDHRLLVRWIAQGLPRGETNAPSVARIEVLPRERLMTPGASQQLAVRAHYTDGSVEDATTAALFEVNDKELAQIGDDGLIRTGELPGDAAVMVRYQGRVAVFRATVPLGAEVTTLPPVRNFVDELVFAKLRQVGMPPSALCDDATFLRRVTLDIAGRLPTLEETDIFLAEKSPDRRDQLIERLLASTDYAEHFAQKWGALLRNRRDTPAQMRGTFAFHAWVRDQLQTNAPFDRIVREILTASGDPADNPPALWYRQVRSLNHQIEDTAQLFLGQRLQCAQCHHHPYEKWSQHDYYSFGAFFSQLARKPAANPGEEFILARRAAPSTMNKKSGQSVPPAGLGAPPPALAPEDDARAALADWMTRPENPLFARSLANRYWKHFLGRGLVEPEDDLRETNPPTNEPLLAALASHFAARHDLKDLVRVICRSSTYQLSAQPNAHNAKDRHYYSRFQPRRLPAETLHDAIQQVLGTGTKFENQPAGTRAVALPDNSFNSSSYFLTLFGRPDSSSACECERSTESTLAQSLHLLNSKELQEKIASSTARPARLLADSSRTHADRLRELHRRAYGREPGAEEIRIALTHIEGTGQPASSRSAQAAYEDIVWTLINTKEFLFNH
jgi:hypothetical protein